MTGAIAALGAMSGTSLDGVDAAVLVTDGESIGSFGLSAYRPYSPEERATLRRALGRWDGHEVEAAARVVEEAHAELLSGISGAALVGFHGQTLAHDPGGRGPDAQGHGHHRGAGGAGDGDGVHHATQSTTPRGGGRSRGRRRAGQAGMGKRRRIQSAKIGSTIARRSHSSSASAM